MRASRWSRWAGVIALLTSMSLATCARADEPRARTPDVSSPEVQEARRLWSQANSVADTKEALAATLRALEAWERVLGPDHADIATILNYVAQLYRYTDDFGRAEAASLRALDIAQKALGSEHPEVAESLENLGLIELEKGDYPDAGRLLRRSLAIREKALDPYDLRIASSLTSLAQQQLVGGGNDRSAEPLVLRALSIYERKLGPDNFNVSHCLHHLARIYEKRGDVDRAVLVLQRALKITEKVGGLESVAAARSHQGLASFYQRNGDFARAEPSFRRAIAILEKVYGPDHPEVILARTDLIDPLVAAGRVEEAVRVMERASDIQDRKMVAVLTTGSQEQKRRYMTRMSRHLHEVISLHVNAAPDHKGAARLALTTLLRRKARILDEMTDSLAVLRRSLAPVDRELLDQLVSVYGQLATESSRGPGAASPEEYRKNLAALELTRRSLEAEIGSRCASFLTEQRLLTLSDVQAMIPEGAALVEIGRYRPIDRRPGRSLLREGHAHYVAYVLRRSGDPTFADLGESFFVDRAADKLRRALADHDRTHDPKPAARNLDRLLMQPIRALLGDTRWVFFGPEGPLHLLPLGALVDEEGHYLVERYLFSYLTTGRDLLRFTSGGPGPREAPLILASPAFGAVGGPPSPEGERRGVRSVDMVTHPLPSLESTVEEAKTIGRLFPESRVLLGADATEEAVKAVHAPLIVHMATHGFFLREQSIPRELLRDDGERLTEPEYQALKQRESPLLRSGVALAGFNQRRSGGGLDDGVLTALEASGLDLNGTRLVVLSACESGVGEAATGEGVYGLRRALAMAGAETQVISLWQVDTGRTREMMQAYYARLKEGAGRGDAMRDVQLAMLSNSATSHPNLWASFIVSGDWRALDGAARLPEIGKVSPGARGCACELSRPQALVGSSARGGWLVLAFGGLTALRRRSSRNQHPQRKTIR